jgi:hypothetical protein
MSSYRKDLGHIIDSIETGVACTTLDQAVFSAAQKMNRCFPVDAGMFKPGIHDISKNHGFFLLFW